MKKKIVVPVVLAILGQAAGAGAAGFALIEQSVSGLGNAFAGGAAVAEDASTIFFNPAGLARLEGRQVLTGAHVVVPKAEFDDGGTLHAGTGLQISGGNGGDGGVTGLVPNFYYGQNLGNGWSIGLGASAPFGLATEYDRTWVGRYHAVNSELMTLNLNPTVAWQVNDRLSLGLGVSAQYLDAELSSAVDFSGTGNVLADGLVTLEGDSWGYGVNAGLLYETSDATRFGLAYRSRVHHDVEGTARFSAPYTFLNTDVTSKVSLPDTASASIFHQLNERWAVMADITWTNWDLFEELRFKFENGAPDGVTTEEWESSWRYSLGLEYSPSADVTLRTGLAYDQTPVPDAEHRTPRIPDEDRLWLAVGVGYRINQSWSLDFGYVHIFVEDPEIDKSGLALAEDLARGGLVGEYDAAVDIASVQLRFDF